MKRIIALFTCCAVFSTCFFCGCKQEETSKQEKNTKEDETTEEVTEEEDTGETTEKSAEATSTAPDTLLDQEKIKEVEKLYISLSKDYYMVPVYADGIRGYARYLESEEDLIFDYTSLNGSGITMIIDEEKDVVSISFRLFYTDTMYNIDGYINQVSVKEIESFIDAAIEGDTSYFEVYDDSALAEHGEDIKTDISIFYARLIALADVAFSEIDLGLEDLGVDLGDKYRSIDPTLAASMEPVVTNEHVFVDGVCSDCGMSWTEYFYDAVGTMDEYASEDWRSVYGQKSYSMMHDGDYVMYSSSGKDYGRMLYYSMNEDLQINYEIEVQNTGITMNVNLVEGQYDAGQGLVGCRFHYYAFINAAPGEFDAIFASKEAFVDACTVYLFYDDGASGLVDVWQTMSEEEIKALFEEEECTYYTREEFLDLAWENHEPCLESLEKGMVWLDTSFADFGFNWKSN